MRRLDDLFLAYALLSSLEPFFHSADSAAAFFWSSTAFLPAAASAFFALPAAFLLFSAGAFFPPMIAVSRLRGCWFGVVGVCCCSSVAVVSSRSHHPAIKCFSHHGLHDALFHVKKIHAFFNKVRTNLESIPRM